MLQDSGYFIPRDLLQMSLEEMSFALAKGKEEPLKEEVKDEPPDEQQQHHNRRNSVSRNLLPDPHDEMNAYNYRAMREGRFKPSRAGAQVNCFALL